MDQEVRGAKNGQVTSSRLKRERRYPGSAAQVFLVFLRLGLTSFGGPVAHIGYFRAEFVERRRWIDDRAFADLVALCHVLPGPASSQLGMSIGLQRAGVLGLIGAWVGFTVPSAFLMFAFALGVTALGDVPQTGWVHGLKAAAAAVVLHAVIGMARSLATGARGAAVAVGAMTAVLLWPGAFVQLGVIIGAAVVGVLWWRREDVAESGDDLSIPLRKGLGIAALCVFALLLLCLPIAAAAMGDRSIALFDSFYRAGSFVFGGGHVVLPLLEAETVQSGLVDAGLFMVGYGAAQAMPGPLFTFAAYLGAVTTSGIGAALGASLALVAIFLPSALLILGVLPFWSYLSRRQGVRRALVGVNAAVVGLLAAALYDPVFTSGVTSAPSAAIVAIAFVSLTVWRVPPWIVVVGAALAGWIML